MKTILRLGVLLAAALLRAETPKPLTANETAALRFLDFVTGPMSAADEKNWWDIGGRQFGLFAKRYHIAFAGYAAAALGMRGTDEERKTVGRILDNCIRRVLARDVWAAGKGGGRILGPHERPLLSESQSRMAHWRHGPPHHFARRIKRLTVEGIA